MTYLITHPGQAGREDLALYRSRGGYRALAQALAHGPAWVLDQVEAAGVRGRGGSGRGLPVAAKWRRVAASQRQTRYVVANGAEGANVSRKDRYLMAHFPHRVLEGLLLAAVAVGARDCYLFVRGDAAEAVAALEAAWAEVQAAGLAGPGTALPVAVSLHRSVPTYVSGEETAVLDAIAGLDGLPQPKPPFPEEAGLFGFPTVVNNVETLAAVAAALREGPERFRAVGTPGCPGSALFTVAGDVARPGVYEVPYGTPLVRLLDQAGAPPAHELLMVLPGGFSSGPLAPHELDVPLTYEALVQVGSSLGNGAVVVFRRPPAGSPGGAPAPPEAPAPPGAGAWPQNPALAAVADVAAFHAQASCGQCRGCKDGTAALAQALAQLATSGSPDALARARALGELLIHGRGNCAHAAGAARFALRALAALA